MDFKKFREIRVKTGVTALELARRSKIDRSRLSMFESGTVELSDKQLKVLTAALMAAIQKRIKNFEAVSELLKGQKEAEGDVGARSLLGDERPDAPGHAQ